MQVKKCECCKKAREAAILEAVQVLEWSAEGYDEAARRAKTRGDSVAWAEAIDLREEILAHAEMVGKLIRHD